MKTITLRQAESNKQAMLDSLKTDCSIDPNCVVMVNQLPSGNQQVLARYVDNEWILPDAICSGGTQEAQKKISFHRLNCESHIEPMKRAIIRYYLKGLPGRGRPKGGSIVNQFESTIGFLNYLSSVGLTDITAVNTMIGSQYVAHCKTLPGSKKGTSIRSSSLAKRLRGIENLHILLHGTCFAFRHPWPESSVLMLSQYRRTAEGKTPIIPDDVAQLVMQKSVRWLEQADYLLACIEITGLQKAKGSTYKEINKVLLANGYRDGLKRLNEDIQALQNACMFIILMTTGIRVHELVNMELDSAFSRINDDGGRQYWIKSVSEKTYEGATQWICPKLCHQAISVAERIVKPLQIRLAQEIENAEDEAQRHRYQANQHRLFLGCDSVKGNHITTLSTLHVTKRLKAFVKASGADWNFFTHQCRRTFAVYVVRHVLGDLRYLRDHYKHWSIDMVAMYAANQAQDRELYDEIYLAMISAKQGKVEHWLDPDTPVAGGLGESIKIFRRKGEHVRTYESRSDMIKGVSDTISIRATGVAWCTADTGGCNGGNGADRTKCGDCDGSIIDDEQQPLWEAIYVQQIELVNIDDIGEQGKITARRALKRCEKVLTDLGADINQLKEVALG